MPTYAAILDAEVAPEQPITVSLLTRLRDNTLSYMGAPTGTKAMFRQTAAPLGWVKDTSLNDRAIRLTSGTVGTGGNVAFTTCFSRITTDPFTIPQTHLPNVSLAGTADDHAHPGGDLFDAVSANFVNARNDTLGVSVVAESGFDVNNSGGGNTAGASGVINLSVSLGGGGNALAPGMDIRVAYADVIDATKN